MILAAGAGFGALGTVVDGRARRSLRRGEHDRLARLTARGYALAEAPLAVALPRLADEAGAPTIDVWWRGEASFIDGPGAARLHAAVDRRWQPLAAGEARGAIGSTVLLEVEPAGGRRRGDTPTELRLATLRPGTEPPRHTATLAANADGLFDVTGLVG